MMVEVDKLNCLLCKCGRGIHDALGAAHKGNYAAIMACIAAVIEKGDAGGIAYRINACFDDFVVPALTDIGDTFNNLCHCFFLSDFVEIKIYFTLAATVFSISSSLTV